MPKWLALTLAGVSVVSCSVAPVRALSYCAVSTWAAAVEWSTLRNMRMIAISLTDVSFPMTVFSRTLFYDFSLKLFEPDPIVKRH